MTESFERDGYAVVAEALTPDEVETLCRAVDRLLPDASPASLARDGQVYASRNLLRDLPEARELAASEAVRSLVEPVLGPGAFAVRGLLFDKSPAANWMVPWHQDLTVAVRGRVEAPGFGPWTVKAGVTHVQPPAEVLARMVTVRVHLDECGVANGPLRVVPGSHAAGRLDAGATRGWLERVGPVSCLVPTGGAVVMRPLILHASSAAKAPARRRVIHLEFAAEELPGGVIWNERVRPNCVGERVTIR